MEALASRPTLVLDRPLVAKLFERVGYQIAAPVSEAAAVEIIKEKWGKKLAEGIIDKLVAELERKGIKVPEAMREAMIDAWATVVTRGLLE